MTGLLLCGIALLARPTSSYVATIEHWRMENESRLKADGSWLTVAGLYWLKEGDNRMGTDPSNGIVLPAGSAPAEVGVVSLRSGRVTLQVSSGADVKVKGEPVKSIDLKSDASGFPVRATIGDLTFIVIERGKRIGIRLFDNNSRARREFTGEKWFLVDEKYKFEAKYVAYPKPKSIPITNVLGDTAPVPNPGYVEFSVDGKMCRLEAQAQGSGLFFNFRDLTSGRETYPAGRFLDAPAPHDGFVTLDFNKATNPPCAFTDFATCPLPPLANYLKVRIEAGEKAYHSSRDRK